MVTLVIVVLLSLLYVVIFAFSAQDAEQSGSVSKVVSEKCVEIVDSLTRRHWTAKVKAQLAAYFEHPIRKLAHFSEYACMGVLVYALWRTWMEKGKKLCLLVVAWVFVSACADEFHQLFVSGRCGSFVDVCIDTCGGICGMLLTMLVQKMWNRRQSSKAQGPGNGHGAADPPKVTDVKKTQNRKRKIRKIN